MPAPSFLAPWRNICVMGSSGIINEGFFLFQRNYVILTHGVCILSIIFVAG
jgi:hypothetical protein